ncbi:Uncharacterized protein APZ42_033381 [Daphnia magna]|uniref:Uncharacterized protein n=1 Tax=Daphnia magna TaxID=35525 RepID=A0A164L581_9CRUS|nr:Uncharacterized protein APZ42_033381 [Daphnia magna]
MLIGFRCFQFAIIMDSKRILMEFWYKKNKYMFVGRVVRVAEEEKIAVNPVLKEAKHSDDMGAQPVETKTLCFR